MVILIGRYLASDFPQLAAPPEQPEWWKASFGGTKMSYGKKTSLSILQQRQNLPIYKLNGELVEVSIYSRLLLHYCGRGIIVGVVYIICLCRY